MGVGTYAQSLASAIPIAGFVDDSRGPSTFQGLPVIRSSDLRADSMVVVASMLRPRTACERLKNLGVEHVDYFAFERKSPLPLKPVAHWDEFELRFASDRSRLNTIRDRFVDERSRETWDRLIEFRLTRDLRVAEIFNLDFVNQYFEDFLRLDTRGEVFADIGAFDGQTSIQFARRCPDFSEILVFEPSPINRAILEQNLMTLDMSRVSIYPFGLGEFAEVLQFDAGLGSSSAITKTGADSIEIRQLDSLNVANLTFAKFDIEGHEIPALRGAAQTVRRFRPRLAVSAYHRGTDFWDLPDLMDELIGPCPLAVRHYTEGIDETVLFFLPTSD